MAVNHLSLKDNRIPFFTNLIVGVDSSKYATCRKVIGGVQILHCGERNKSISTDIEVVLGGRLYHRHHNHQEIIMKSIIINRLHTIPYLATKFI